MNNSKYFIAILFLVGILSSCEDTFSNVVDVDRSHLTSKGVIFGLISNSDPRDSIFQEQTSNQQNEKIPSNRIFISHSSPSFKQQHDFYKADISLKSGEDKIKLQYFSKNADQGAKEPFYGIMEAIKPGEIYRISAQSDTATQAHSYRAWAPVSAADTMPMPVPIEIEGAEIHYGDLAGSESEGYIDLVIRDEPYKRNMYQIEIAVVQSQHYIPQLPFDLIIPVTVEGDEDRVSTEVFGTYHHSLVHEAEFNRYGHKRIKFHFHTNHGFFNKEKPVTLIVRFSNLSHHYVEFLRSSRRYFAMGENPFAEPAEIYSNIHNGYGIFAFSARSYAEYTIR